MMKPRNLIVTIAAVSGLFVTGAAAQHQDHQPDQAANPQTEMCPMMARQTDVATLVDRLAKNFAAIEAEQDPAARAQQMADYDALLKELQTKVHSESQMGRMGRMMGRSNPNGPAK